MYTKLVIRFSKRALLLGVVILISTYSDAQLQYNFERINTDNGLPTNAIKGLQFDEKTRFLWVATESGIVRYNGHGFQSFGDNVSNAALNGRINFFIKAFDGRLFGKLIDGRVFIIKNNKAIIDTAISQMAFQEDYLSYKYKISPKKYISKRNEIELSDFVFQKNIYTSYDYLLYKFEDDFKPIEKIKNEKLPFIINGRLFFLDLKGLIFEAQIKGYQLNKYNNIDLFKSILIKQKKSNYQIHIFQNHPSEPVYLTFGQKLYIIKQIGNRLKFDLITDQLPDIDFIKYIQIDNETSTIYIGTDNRGLIIARPKYFNRILPVKQVSGISSSTYAQLLLKNGNIQINTGQIFGNKDITSTNIFYKPSNTATYITRDSVLYFTNMDGIVAYDLKINKIQSVYNNINANRNYFIEIGGKLYSFNESGIAIKKQFNQWGYILKFKKVPSNFIIYDIKKINHSELLIATTDGLYKYNHERNKFIFFYRDKNKANFRTIYAFNDYFLIGTYGSGVYMYKNDTIKQLPLDQNKFLSYTHCFLQDEQKRVWASTNKGLFMLVESSLIDFWAKGPGNIKFTYFGKPDGIDQLEFNGGCSPCAIKLPDGIFSYPGIDGLIQFNPNKISITKIQPKIYIDRLIIDGNYMESDLLNKELSSTTKSIEIQLGISGMLTEENIMLEYKLDDELWTRTNVKNSILKFGNLSFGSHVISMRLRNTINNKWQLFEYPFSIKYPWTLNPIMYFVYLIIAICIVLLYIRFKTIIYQRRQKQLEVEVNSKTESLNKLNEYLLKRNQAKDHVIAIMNHDILTPLKYLHITAKNIAESTNPNQVKSSIKQIADTSKELEYLTSNMLNWVKFDNIERLPKKQDFDLSILVTDLIEFVHPFIQNKQIQILNVVPPESFINNWPDSLRVLLYNLLVNAIKATHAGTIKIGFKLIEGGYLIFMEDTGIGMSNSMIDFLLKGKHEDLIEIHPKFKTGNGVGYQIIRNIVNLMNANLDIESVQNKGTTINIIFI